MSKQKSKILSLLRQIPVIFVLGASLVGCSLSAPFKEQAGIGAEPTIKSWTNEDLVQAPCNHSLLVDPLFFGEVVFGEVTLSGNGVAGSQAQDNLASMVAVYPRTVRVFKTGRMFKTRAAGLFAQAYCYSAKQEFTAALVSSGMLFGQTKDLSVVVYDLQTGRLLNSSTKIVTRLRALSALGDSVLLGGLDGIVYRWWWRGAKRLDFAGNSMQVERYIGHGAAIEALAWLPNGKTFFSADASGAVSGWQVFENDMLGGAYDKSKSAGDLFTAKATRTALSRTTATRSPVTQLLILKNTLNSDQNAVGSDANSYLLLIATADATVELWQIQGLKMLDSISLNSAEERGKDLKTGSDADSNARFSTHTGAPRSTVNISPTTPIQIKADRNSALELALVDRSGQLTKLSVQAQLDKLGINRSLAISIKESKRTDALLLLSIGNSLLGLIEMGGLAQF